MEEYESWNATLHPIVCVFLFHLKFARIHPFIDGNGCTGRLLLNLELMRAGYPAINVKFADRRRYYDCFAAYHQSGGNPEEMLKLVSEYVEEALEQYLRIVG